MGRRDGPGVFISALVPGGLAEQNATLLQGDQIIRVNSTDLTNATQVSFQSFHPSQPPSIHISPSELGHEQEDPGQPQLLSLHCQSGLPTHFPRNFLFQVNYKSMVLANPSSHPDLSYRSLACDRIRIHRNFMVSLVLLYLTTIGRRKYSAFSHHHNFY